MASTNPFHRRNLSSPQSIPLRDLQARPDNVAYQVEEQSQRQRTLSHRERASPWSGQSHVRGGRTEAFFETIGESSQTQAYGLGGRDQLPSARSNNSFENVSLHSGDGDLLSPLDRSGFQQATGFGETTSSAPLGSPLLSPRTTDKHPSMYHRKDSDSSNQQSYDEGPDMFSGAYVDTAPLTDPVNMQPISGADSSAPAAKPRSRAQSNVVRFLNPNWVSTGSKLGDDLEPGMEREGARGTSFRDRTLSLAVMDSPLHRAGTIVRKMSQRVVNLSNEPELIEKNTKRRDAVNVVIPPVPALPESFPDDSTSKSPVEKVAVMPRAYEESGMHPPPSSLFRGRSLGIFSPDNKLRLALCELLVHQSTEPVILLLIFIQTLFLTYESFFNVFLHPRSKAWGSSWVDYGMLALFAMYTAEIFVKVIVSGLLINPIEYSTIDRQQGFMKAIAGKVKDLFAPPGQASGKTASSSFAPQPSIIRSFTTSQAQFNQANNPQQQQRLRLAHRAFLRHSFNRLDFVAVVSFWISFALGLWGTESVKYVYVFRMLSCLRILRLLLITNGTSVILRSLKRAAPLLANVAFLIGFFWLLFAIVGVQSFQSSLRRSCVWVDPEGRQENFTNNAVGNFQFCGGYINQDGEPMPWLTNDGRNGTSEHKGFLCPQNSLCVEGLNPYNGTVSFDNIIQSLELVFVIMSSNTFSDILYYLTDSDHLAAAIFFAAGIVIMTLWLINLLIAVITSSFQVIREESKSSAFTTEESNPLTSNEDTPRTRRSLLQRMYQKTSPFWILVITFGLVCQGLRRADMGDQLASFINNTETVITFVLAVEIILRLSVDWNNFFRHKRNIFDLGLAVVTCIIQIPVIRNSGQPYSWLTIFQIIRVYRVVLAVPLTRNMITVVLKNASGLFNLIFFVFLLTYLAALFAAQIFRGSIPERDSNGDFTQITFFNLYNSFLGMYQVLSSENWTAVLFNVTNYSAEHRMAWIGAAFLILWFILANFIVLNMFIAVIQENFDVSEDEKRMQQVRAFLHQKEMGSTSQGNLSLSTMFKFGQVWGRPQDPFEFGSAATEMLLKDAVVRDFLDDQDNAPDAAAVPGQPGPSSPADTMGTPRPSSLWGRIISKLKYYEPNPFYSRLDFSKAYQDLDPRAMAKEVVAANERRKKAQRDYLRRHPNYNVSLYIFRQNNPIRRVCQRLVGPGRGSDRIEGVAPSMPLWYAFSAFIYAAIVVMVVIACISTPLYQKEYFETHKFSVKNWFVFTDLGFAILFTIEAGIKVIADGLFWTPNAYFRGSWGLIDGLVLITLWINVGAALSNQGSVSRVVGAFKALRALRLLNISNSARDTFYFVIVRGGWKVLSAAFVSLSLLIPFGLYGLNLFNGKMQMCNDQQSTIFNLTDCVNEYRSTPYKWEMLAPRAVSNPYYDFDTFGGSLFILYQIVSQEGWMDVMWSAESITGVFTQPRPFASQGNGTFFVIFNLLGAVFVLTLFISVFMRNYTEQTGVAFLTTEQRSWLELRKILRQVSPSKRPAHTKKMQSWEEWCYHRSIRKTGAWQRFITLILVLHLILLCLEFSPISPWWNRAREYAFLLFTLIYIANILIRIIGLTWSRFRRSAWDLYALVVVFGTLVTSVTTVTTFGAGVFPQLNKIALVSITLLLIPRNDQLDQLFKTAAASFTAIANLLATWFVLFLVFAIAFTQIFGLTKINANGNGNINFRTVPKALILLFRMSMGEGWNEIMEDYATAQPPRCIMGTSLFDGDCGSPSWARALFVSWNFLSMYIFVNLFISLIYESFSYVYQRSAGLSVVTRDEIRKFKQAWAEFDPNGTGYISKEAFPKLLRTLSGVFEMRVYDEEFTIKRLVQDCRVDRTDLQSGSGGDQVVDGIDLQKLRYKLSQLPVEKVRQRRRRMDVFYEEVFVSADPEKGIGFSSLLMILAHYNIINDNKSLRLEEYLRRRARLQRVEEAVRRNVVIGFFSVVFWSRRFRKAVATKRAGRQTKLTPLIIPEILVEDEDGPGSGPSPRDVNSSDPASWTQELRSIGGSDTMRATGVDTAPMSPPGMTARYRSNSIQISPVQSPRAMSPQRNLHGRTGSDISGEWDLSHSPGRQGSTQERGSVDMRPRALSTVSAQDVRDVLESSAWGESIRRSFSMRRSSSERQ